MARETWILGSFFLALFTLLPGTPALADWLVTVDGERIETHGPWRVEGRRVLFELPNGNLSALRLSEVDLEASRAASEAPRAAEPSEAERAAADDRPALVLTEENVATLRVPSSSEVDDAPDVSVQSAERSGTVAVVTWREVSSPGEALRIGGQIANGTDTLAARVRLVVTLYDESGAVVGRQPADVARQSLRPGQSTSFEASFPGLYVQSGASFQLDWDPIVIGGRSGEGEEEGEGEDSEEGSV